MARVFQDGWCETHFWTCRWAINRSIVGSVTVFLLFHQCKVGRVVAHVGEDHSLLVIVFAENFVVTQKETISYAESGTNNCQVTVYFSATTTRYIPVIALLAGETFQMVNICPGSHDHFESRDHFVASTTIPSCAKKSAKKKWSYILTRPLAMNLKRFKIAFQCWTRELRQKWDRIEIKLRYWDKKRDKLSKWAKTIETELRKIETKLRRAFVASTSCCTFKMSFTSK